MNAMLAGEAPEQAMRPPLTRPPTLANQPDDTGASQILPTWRSSVKTKTYVRFLNRAAHFDADIELVDVFALGTRSGALVPASGTPLFEGVDQEKHPRLANRQANDNRKLALTHLKRTLAAAFIKDLYEDVSTYLTDLLAAAARSGLSPDRLVGEHKMSLDANDLLRCQSWENVVQMVSRQLFRRLEDEKSTIKLLTAVDKKLDLGADATLREEALPYLELRHLLVHADGVADEAFCRRYPSLAAVPGEAIALNGRVVKAAREKVVAMVQNYDECAVAKLGLPNEDLQP